LGSLYGWRGVASKYRTRLSGYSYDLVHSLINWSWMHLIQLDAWQYYLYDCVRTTGTAYIVVLFSAFFSYDFEVEQFYSLDYVQVTIVFNNKKDSQKIVIVAIYWSYKRCFQSLERINLNFQDQFNVIDRKRTMQLK
jgi:hypothetical protein